MTHLSMKAAGVDTGKDELHAHILPGGESFCVKNNDAGVEELVARCRKAGVERVAIESTSIYHRLAARALARAGIETALAQPRQSRAFAEAILKWSKSDPIDAFVLARFAQVLDTVRPLAPEKTEAMAEALTFIEELEERCAWLKTTRERFKDPRILKAIDRDIKAIGRQRAAELVRLEARLRTDEALAARLDLLLSIPCVAERTALCLLIRMPELGAITREETASLAGLAPVMHESAKFKGQRHIYGGRAKVRKSLFMAAFTGATRWNPELKAFYQRLVAKGKAHVEAVTACARKLAILANTILHRGTPWKSREVMP